MRRAFSLIELLVVVSIVVVLAGLLLPAVGLVREQARTLQCAGNLRGLGLAMAAYAGDCNGVLIDACKYDITGWIANSSWDDEFMKAGYIERIAQVQCPNDDQPKWHSTLGQPRRGYGANWKTVNDYTVRVAPDPERALGLAFSRITRPGSKVLLADSAKYYCTWDSMADVHLWSDADIFFTWPDGTRPRLHGGGGRANYLFADGHVKTLGQPAAGSSAQAANYAIWTSSGGIVPDESRY